MSQQVRAINVAALPGVRHVYVSESNTPENDILKLKPDFFVMGYSPPNGHPDTKIRDLVSDYGGELIIAPGDINFSTYSPTGQRISLNEEQLVILRSLMKAENVSFDDLRRTIDLFPTLDIHVVGDLIIDEYKNGTHLGQNSKGAYPSIKLLRIDTFVGGAGIVAKHLQSLGVHTTFTTVIGTHRNVAEADFAQQDLAKSGVAVNAILDHTRPTTVKSQILADGHPVAQLDDLENIIISEKHLEKICSCLQNDLSQAVVCSDFRHGIFDGRTSRIIADSVRHGTLKVADSQVASRWGNILDFSGFGLITPNIKEARFALGDQDSPIGPLAQRLHRESQTRYLILKLGADGIIAHQRADQGLRAGFPLASFASRVVDAVGAGDALLATATATLTASPDQILQAAILGSMGAALECSKLGNIPIATEELSAMMDELENQIRQVS